MGIENFSKVNVPQNEAGIEEDPKMSEEELIEWRQNQSGTERLAEYITGLRLDNPKFVERLVQDQQILRNKYNLPDIASLENSPSEFEANLLEMAQKLGVAVRSKAEVGHFFIEHPHADGVHLGEDAVIATDIDRSEIESYMKSLKRLEHELVHAVQNAKYPSMPIEAMEYEAYVANANFNHLDDMEPEEIKESLDAFFQFTIGGSVDYWYENEAEKNGLDKEPVWNNPEYFLQNIDGISRTNL